MTTAQYSIAETRPVARTRAKEAGLWLAGTMLVIAVFNLATLLRAPAPFWDEVWNASRSWAFLQTGRAFSPLDGGVIENYEGYWTVFPLIATAIHALSIEVFGLGLFAMRFVSLLFGLLLLAAIYVIANRFYGARVGMLAVVLVALSPAFVYTSHLGRHDIIAAALGYGAIALYLADRGNGLSIKSVLCGLALGISLDVHLNGVIFGPAILALYLLDYGWAFLRSGRFWGFVAGGCAGLGYYLAMHVLPYPDTFFTLISLTQGSTRVPALLTPDAGVWVQALAETVLRLDLLALLGAGAAVYLWRRGLAADKRVLVLLGALMLAFIIVIRPKQPFYAILVSPVVCLALAPLLARLVFEKWQASVRFYIGVVLVFGLLAGTIVRGLTPLLYDAQPEFALVLERVSKTIPAGSTAVGPATYWLAVPGNAYLPWENVRYYQNRTPGATYQDALRAMRPDFLIIDGPDTWSAEFGEFLESNAEPALELPTRSFGTVRVYKMEWN